MLLLSATLDDLLTDEVMAPVLRSAGYEPDEFRYDDNGDGLESGHALIELHAVPVLTV